MDEGLYQMSSIKRVLSRWGLKIPLSLRVMIGRIIAGATPLKSNTSSTASIYSPSFTLSSLTGMYTQGTRLYSEWMERDPELSANGLLYYGANVLYGICNYERLEELYGDKTLERILDVSLRVGILAVVADDIIDSHPEDVPQLKVAVEAALRDPEGKIDVKSERVGTVHTLVCQLMKADPTVSEYICKAFRAEIDSMKQVGVTPGCSNLRDIEHSKGTLAFELINHCLSGGVTKVPENMGYLVQLYDDIMDMYVDREEGVMTVVLSELAKTGSLDTTLECALEILDSLPPEYWLMKMVGVTSLSSLTSSNAYVSESVRRELTPYLPYLYRGVQEEDVPYVRHALACIHTSKST